MFSNFKPTWMVDAIYKITPEQLQTHGIKAVLTDLDNTLIAWNNPEGTIELQQWLLTLKKAGIPVIVVSNNNEERVRYAVERFDIDFVARALKPLGKGIREGVRRLNLSKDEVVMVGDQIMTDVRAANRVGVRSILVKPIIDTDSWKTQFNRLCERQIMRYLQKKNPEMVWQGEIT
ncbi:MULTISPECIES: YqeG family HAD IIIA-type phosphatase [Enterococcus]|uniref:HAD phosphatase, family IIIA n=1 Tax=Enterococcus sulfureus ATCC 49903 TaxID=1140003 RepID=S0L115_9ENTE|nr:YqeG family HAD IIIA-type phosphatase [Enterococcus sulfureus]EOT46970.1 HAD phosphatase, family IIIA [Enterococcus sulfureus ATCC 49903]EOT83735.1 HAD phosphatase, family IIIA [Enterococcus sulfureus ATCC 49903]